MGHFPQPSLPEPRVSESVVCWNFFTKDPSFTGLRDSPALLALWRVRVCIGVGRTRQGVELRVPFLFCAAFSSSLSFRFSGFASCSDSRATCPGYGHFEKVYSQLQPYKSAALGGLSLDTSASLRTPCQCPGGRCRREAYKLASSGLWQCHFQEGLLLKLRSPTSRPFPSLPEGQ